MTTATHFIPHQDAFIQAIRAGKLCSTPDTPTPYAGDYMYMGSAFMTNGERQHAFKNINTRLYLYAAITA